MINRPPITAIGLVLVAMITYFFNRGSDRRRVLEDITREQKITLYGEIVEFMLSFLTNAPSITTPSQDESLDFLAKCTPRMITYGSNRVVKKWGVFMRGIPRLSAQGDWELMIGLEGVLKAMRKDVGHSSLTLTDGDLARLFITDIDETIAARKAAKRAISTASLPPSSS